MEFAMDADQEDQGMAPPPRSRSMSSIVLDSSRTLPFKATASPVDGDDDNEPAASGDARPNNNNSSSNNNTPVYSGSGKLRVKRLPCPEKPPGDPKSYRVIELENSAKAVLISEIRNATNSRSEDRVKLPYISDSGNAIVGQNKKMDQPEKPLVSQYCCNCGGGFSYPSNLWDECMSSLDTSNVPQDFVGASPDANAGSNQMVSCAVSVGSGFLDEPSKYCGLAHFCEHMVFLGSEGNPRDDEFMALVKEYDGDLNACTMPESTHFYYSIANTPSNGCNILDRTMELFSQFFVQPKFSVEAIKKEINALDHEFRMKRPNDVVCRLEILKHTITVQDHPIKKFFWGDKGSLGGEGTEEHFQDLKQHLTNFHRDHYIASNLTIAIQGHLSLDELEDRAVRFFSKLRPGRPPCKDVPPELERPFGTPEFNRRYFVKPVGSLDALYLSWSLPKSTWGNYWTKPLPYLNNVITSEISGGLADTLKRERLIVELQCGAQLMSQSKYGILLVLKMYLTDEGVSQQDRVIQTVFSYLDTIRVKGISQAQYRSMQLIRDANLTNYGDQRPQILNVKKLSSALQLYPPEHIITGDTKFFKFDRKPILNVLNDLTPQTMNVMLFSHRFGKQLFPNTEQNTNCKFDFADIGLPDIKAWTNKTKRTPFNVPIRRNPYMTTDFTNLNYQDVKPEFTPVKISEKLIVTLLPLSLKFPFGCFHLVVQSKGGRYTGSRQAMLQLFAAILTFELREPIGLANEVGIHCEIEPESDGNLHIKVCGYDKMGAKLVKDIMVCISEMKFVQDDLFFELSKEYLLKSMYSSILSPSALAINLLSRACKWGDQSILETHAALASIDFQNFQSFIRHFMSEMKITLLALGNSPKEEISDIANIVDKICYNALTDKSSHIVEKSRTVSLPKSKLIWRVDSLNKVGTTSTIVNYHQFTRLTLETFILSNVILRMMAQPIFADLRTQRSLGYAVNSVMHLDNGVLGATFWVISDADKFTMQQLDSELEDFLVRFYDKKLKYMSEAEFQEWGARFPGIPLGNFTAEQLRTFYQEYLFPEGRHFRKLSIQVCGHEKSSQLDNVMLPDDYKKKQSLICFNESTVECLYGNKAYIIDVDMFHAQCPLFPAASSYGS